MQNPRLATRYAKSLLDLTIERNSLEITLADMQSIEAVCHQCHDFENMLRSPIIHGDKKLAIVDEVFGKDLHELTRAFIALLVTKGRELNLSEIASAFITQYNVYKNITLVKLTTAAPLDAKVKDAIVAKIGTYMAGNTVDMTTEVDPDLIGGFVVEVADKLYDASIRKRLADVRAKVVDTSYVSKI